MADLPLVRDVEVERLLADGPPDGARLAYRLRPVDRLDVSRSRSRVA